MGRRRWGGAWGGGRGEEGVWCWAGTWFGEGIWEGYGRENCDEIASNFQLTFIEFIIYPLWEMWAELVYPDAQHVMDGIAGTKKYWSELKEVS
jgi:hypothetical protein